MNGIDLLFWLCLSGLFYIYLGYPVLIGMLARWRPRVWEKRPDLQPVSVLIAAHNEAGNLPEKIRSLLASEPSGLVDEIVVVSDGSTDGTEAAVRALADPRLRLVVRAERRGKPAVLNETLPTCRNAIVVLTDARQVVHPRAVAALLSNFADPGIGVVSGELEFVQPGSLSSAARGLDAYWRYEKWIRRNEARFGSVPGATGALYALRRELFRPIPPDTLLDDVAIPLAVVRQGRRCVFETGALVYDAPSGTPRQEAIRKRRTIAGVLQLVRAEPALLWPGANPIWFQFLSHKLARLFSPFLLLGLLVMNVILRGSPGYDGLLAAQGIFYLAAALGWLLQRAGIRSRWAGAALMFVRLNGTTVLAWWDALTGRYRVTWDRSAHEARSSETNHG